MARGKKRTKKEKQEITVTTEEDFIVKALLVGNTSENLMDNVIKSISKQEKESKSGISSGTLQPRYDPKQLLELLDVDTRLKRCVVTYARNTVGLGWDIVLDPDIKWENEDEDLREEAKKQEEILRDFFNTPNDKEHFSKIMEKVVIDREGSGNGYLEVSNSGTGRPDGCYHASTLTTRKLAEDEKLGERFIQKTTTKTVYFRGFGSDVVISKKDGKPKPSGIPFDERANDIIHFSIYDPNDPDNYGTPRWVTAIPAIVGSRLAAIRNVNFFKNDAVPRMVVVVSGGQLDAQSITYIENFFNQTKGPENSHRVMVIQAEPKRVAMSKENPTKIDLKPLTVGTTDDASFLKFTDSNAEQVRECFGITKLFLGTTSDFNKATASVARAVTLEQEFIPAILLDEYIINHTIVKKLLQERVRVTDSKFLKMFKDEKPETENETILKLKRKGLTYLETEGNGDIITHKRILVKFVFKRPRAIDDRDAADLDTKYAEKGGLTINELRARIKMPPLSFEWAKKPLPIVLKELIASRGQEVTEKNVENSMFHIESIVEGLVAIRDSLEEKLRSDKLENKSKDES